MLQTIRKSLKKSLLITLSAAIVLGTTVAMGITALAASTTENTDGTTTFTLSNSNASSVSLHYAPEADASDASAWKSVPMKNNSGTYTTYGVFVGKDAVDIVYYYDVDGTKTPDPDTSTQVTVDGNTYSKYTRAALDSDTGRTVTLPGTLPSGEGSWNAATNLMTYQGNGVYTYTLKACAAGAYTFKAAINKTWGENYGVNGVMGGSNISIAVPEAQDLTITYDDSTHLITTNAVAADITLSGTGIPDGTTFSDPNTTNVYTATVKLTKGTYSDVKATWNNKQSGAVTYSLPEFTVEYDKSVTFTFNPLKDDDAKLSSDAEASSVKDVTISPGSDATQMNFAWYGSFDTTSIVKLVNGTTNKVTYFTGGTAPIAVTGTSYYANDATVTGLTTGTTYTYTVGNSTDGTADKAIWDKNSYSFTTAASTSSYSFLFAGDPQLGASGSYSKDTTLWDSAMKTLLTNPITKNVAFMISAGDQINDSGATNEAEYDGYLGAYGFQTIPVAETVGNHDYDGGITYQYHFNMSNLDTLGSENVNNTGGDYWYTYGSTLFMDLNSNDTNTADHKAFIEKAIAANPDAKWRIVVFHHSIYSVANHAADSDILSRRSTLPQVFQDNGIDVVLMGHDHSYTRTYQMLDGAAQKDQTVNADGQVVNPTGILYLTANSASGSKYYSIQTGLDFSYADKYTQEKTPTITKIDITDDSFTLNTYLNSDLDADGANAKSVDSYSILKTSNNGGDSSSSTSSSSNTSSSSTSSSNTSSSSSTSSSSTSSSSTSSSSTSSSSTSSSSTSSSSTSSSSTPSSSTSSSNTSSSSTSSSSTPSSSTSSSNTSSDTSSSLTDSDTGIEVTGALPSGATVNAESISSGTASYTTVKNVLSDVAEKFTAYTITLTKDNSTVQPDGSVQVSVPIPSGYDSSRLAIYYIKDDGSKEKMTGSVSGSNYVFSTTHFSIYALVQLADSATSSESTSSSNTASTSSSVSSTASTSSSVSSTASTSSSASSTASTSSSASSTVSNAKTGATSPVSPVASIIILASAVAGVAIITRRKK